MWKRRQERHITVTPPSPMWTNGRRVTLQGALGLVVSQERSALSWVISLPPWPPWWGSRAVLLFHYHRGSRSKERRHHYPSGLMRLSRCRKGQAITAGAVFSLETPRCCRVTDSTGGLPHTHKHTAAARVFSIHASSLWWKSSVTKRLLYKSSKKVWKFIQTVF